MNKHQEFMQQALFEAQKSRPCPNPQVGALIVKNNEVISRGFHERPGKPHAEIMALNKAGSLAKDATLYVNLEPCCHYGKTGPCTSAIIEAGIKEVIISITDPDEKVSGQGIKFLNQYGIKTTTGILKEECKNLLSGYIHHRKTGQMLVTCKAAMTLDGYIATQNGDSKWITGKTARAHGHYLRSTNDLILVGKNTILIDDPLLTVRDAHGQHPTRVILDTNLSLHCDKQIFKTSDLAKVIIAHDKNLTQEKKQAFLNQKNIILLPCKTMNNQVDPASVLEGLQDMGFLSVLIEGGGLVLGSFIKQQLVHKLALFIAPLLLGNGRKVSTFNGISTIDQAISLQNLQTTPLGKDLLITGDFTSTTNYCSSKKNE